MSDHPEKQCCHDLPDDEHHSWCHDDERGDYDRDVKRDRDLED